MIRTSSGESRIACGNGSWKKGRSSFVNGLDNRMVLPSIHPVAASGAWTADDTYTVKLCLHETPFYTTFVFHFNGEQIVFDSEYNVAFTPMPTTLPQLVGHAP